MVEKEWKLRASVSKFTWTNRYVNYLHGLEGTITNNNNLDIRKRIVNVKST